MMCWYSSLTYVILLIFVLSGKSIADMLPTLTLVAIAIAKITPFANNLTKNLTKNLILR